MFTTERMERLHILFYEPDVEPVADALVRQGSLQLVDTAEMETWAENLEKAGTGVESAQIRERQDTVESMFRQLSAKPDLKHAKSPEMSWPDIDLELKKLKSELEGLIQSQEETGRELNRLEELKKHLEETPRLGLAIDQKEAYTYLAVETGRVARENMDILRESLEHVLHVLSPVGEFGGMITVILVSLSRDREKIQKALREAGAQQVDTQKEAHDLTPEAMQSLDLKISETRALFGAVTEKIQAFTKTHTGFLNSLLYHIKRDALKQQILKFFRKTEHTFLISGWIPAKERESLIREVRRATQNRCVIEKNTAEEMESVRQGKLDVPVKLKNMALFKPFELITGAYGIPDYRSIDPTPILGLSFMMMFGMMFGDLGHGLVLAVLGLIFIITGKREILKNAGLLMIYVGASSMVFGMLFGSFFGFEHLSWLPTVWVKPMESISELFKVAIYFGIGMIFLSILINMINAFRRRKFMHAIFDKAGLLAAILYWCGIAVATRVISTNPGVQKEIPLFIMVPMILSVVLLFLRAPIIHLAEGKKQLFHDGIATGIMGGIVELLEIFLGFLANTVSFIRVAAFGLAHAGLFMAIFTLSDMVGGGVGSFFVMLFGNIIIILLEGMVVTIQAVRLEFYEFFSRFFQQGKVQYKPLSAELTE